MHSGYDKWRCCFIHCYTIHLFLLDIFQKSYFYPSGVCGHNIDPVNGIVASKAFALSITNAHYFLRFIGSMLYICVATIPINNISNIILATLDDQAQISEYHIYIQFSFFILFISEPIPSLTRTGIISLFDTCDPSMSVGLKCWPTSSSTNIRKMPLAFITVDGGESCSSIAYCWYLEFFWLAS